MYHPTFCVSAYASRDYKIKCNKNERKNTPPSVSFDVNCQMK